MGRPPNKKPAPPKPVLAPQGKGLKRTPQNSFDPAAGKDIYEPEEIVAKRTAKGVLQWQVKWRGYDSKANTWEPIENLAGCEDLIADYEERTKARNAELEAEEKRLREKKQAEEKERREKAIKESAGPARSAGATTAAEVEGKEYQKSKQTKRSSEVWSCYSEVGATKPKHAVCTLDSRTKHGHQCGEEITFAYGTTAMWNHVMWHHPDDYIQLNKEKPSKASEQAISTAGATPGSQLPRMPAAKRDELHKAHARWLTKKKRPLALVEDTEYREIWHRATQGTYQPPDRTTLRSFILGLSKEGQERVRKVNEVLRADHRKPSIAGDIWSTKNHTLSLLGITQYHINSKWEIEELLVAADPFSRESHTGEAIAQHTKDCLHSMNYPKDIYSGVFKKTSDNGSNMLKGWKGFQGGSCVDHTAQLSLGVFMEHEGIAPTVAKEKGITAHFHRSTGVDGLGGLTSCQVECKLPKRHPVQGCPTRWSSWGEMLEFYRLEQRAVQLYDVRHSRNAGGTCLYSFSQLIICITQQLNDVSHQHSRIHAGDAYRQFQMDLNDWRVNEQACAVVQLMNDWVQLMEGTKTYPTLPLVLPTVYNLLNMLRPDAPLICDFEGDDRFQLAPHEMHPAVLAARNALHSDMKARFITNLDLNFKRQYAIATVLHPCFKEYLFPGASDAEKAWVMVELRTEWRTHWKTLKPGKEHHHHQEDSEENEDDELEAPEDKLPDAEIAIDVDADEAPPAPVPKKQRTVSLSSLMRGAQVGQPPPQVKTVKADQLEEYLNEPTISNLDVKVLKYWQGKEELWPELARMVKQYFAAPASSAGVERVFSAAGKMHDDMRKAMKEGTLKHSLFAGQNND